MYRVVLFDLDGTLNTAQGVLHSFAWLSQEIERPLTKEQLSTCIGPPIRVSFRKYFSDLDEEELVDKYRTHYKAEGMRKDSLYPCLQELLMQLHSQDVKIGLATSKISELARKFLADNDIEQYFSVVVGGDAVQETANKKEIVRVALKQFSNTSKKEGVMVGDKEYDVQAAMDNGIDSVFVTWGFGNDQEGKDATFTVNSVKKLRETLNIK